MLYDVIYMWNIKTTQKTSEQNKKNQAYRKQTHDNSGERMGRDNIGVGD